MRLLRLVFASLVFLAGAAHAQSFEGLYKVGSTTFTARALSGKDRENNYFNIVYVRGDKGGTMASISADESFELVFDEFLGDRLLGTFYFTKTWKGRPLEGVYVRYKGGRTLPVSFVRELRRDELTQQP